MLNLEKVLSYLPGGREFCLKVGNSCKYMKLLSNYIIAIMCRVRPKGQVVPEITTLEGGGTKGGYFGNTSAPKGLALHKKTMPACDGCGIMHAKPCMHLHSILGWKLLPVLGSFHIFQRIMSSGSVKN